MQKKGKKKQCVNIPPSMNPLKAYKQGVADGVNGALNQIMQMVVWTLVDNEFLDDEGIWKFHDRFNSTLDMIESGNITHEDIRKTLKDEYDWEVAYH